jgi:ubiquinone/menaquinone biosynthesis C-methylase UbiE
MKIVNWLPRYYGGRKLMRDLQPGCRVLDIACGEGDLTKFLGERGCKAWGADLCEADIRKGLPKNLHSNVGYMAADICSLPFAGESLDWIVSFDTLDDVPEEQRAISEIRRVLKRGGIFLLCAPAKAPTDGDLFWEQRALRRWLPKILYTRSRSKKTGHGWLDANREDIVQLRDYSLEDVLKRFAGFELVEYDYAVKHFSAVAMDFGYGVRGFPQLGLKPYLYWISSRLDAMLCAGSKHVGYTMLAKLRKKS